MSNLLGDNFKPYVARQIKTRQDILGRRESGILSDSNSNEAIMWENGKTSYIALASSVDIKDSPIFSTEVSVNINVTQGFGVSTVTTSSEEGEDDSFVAADVEAPLPTTLSNTNPVQIEWLLAYTEEEANIEASYLLAYMIIVGTLTSEIEKVFDRIKTVKRYEQVVDAFRRLFGRTWKNGAGGVPDFNTLNVSNAALSYIIRRNPENNPFNNGDLNFSLVDEEDDKFLADLMARLKDDTGYAFLSSPTDDPSKISVNEEAIQSPLAGQVTYIITNNPNFREISQEEIDYNKAVADGDPNASDLPGSPENIALQAFIKEQAQQTTAVQDATYVDPTYAGTAVIKYLNSQISTNTTVNTTRTKIGNDGLGTKRIQEALKLEGGPNQYLGNFVAKNMVLTNGTTLVNEDGKRTYKEGIANTNSTFNDFVYGFGGDKDFGLVAMPGLEGVDIKSKNMGSLREATVTLRANSERQFALIDTMYCRIGYSMFLEWGHSVYFNNTSDYISDPLIDGVPSLIPLFLNPKSGETCISPNLGIQKQIELNRNISCGNYDAFMGRVTNFSWEFDPSGYYKVTLKLASIGDIIESLGIDQPLPNILEATNIPALGAQPSFNSALETFLTIAATPNGTSNAELNKLYAEDNITNTYDIFKRTLVANNTYVETDTNDLWTTSAGIAAAAAFALTGGTAGVAVAAVGGSGAVFGASTAALIAAGGAGVATTIGAGGLAARGIEELGWAESEVTRRKSQAQDFSPELRYERAPTSKGKIISARASFGTNIYNYIRLGDILDFIKAKLLIYNSECGGEPIVDIDTDTNTNFCYYSGANISADPSKVMVRAKLPLSLEKLYGYAGKKDNLNDPYWSHGVEQDGIFGSSIAQIEEFVTDEAFTSSKQNLLAGVIMNIYFEYQYLLDEIESSRDSESKSLNLLKFLDKILTTANSSLGGVNKLAVRIKDDNVIEIYDQIPIYGSQAEAPLSSILSLYGVGNTLGGSFVRNFGITTELTSEFAAQVTIGAQAQGSKDTTDALALSNWNYGLIDRWIPKKLSAAEVDGTQTKEATNYESLIAIRDKLAFLWLGYSQGQVVNETDGDGVFKRELTDEEVFEFYKTNKPDTVKTDEEGNTTIDVGGLFNDQVDNLIENNLYYFKDFPTKQYSEFVKLQQNFLSLLHINSDFNSNQQGMLPINISLDIEGLSGVRIYDQLPVDVRFIPNYYPQTLHWIIKGVSHTIVNNVWTTKLETIAVPKIEELPPGDLPTKSTRIANQAYKKIPDSDIIAQDFDIAYTPEEYSAYVNRAFKEALKTQPPIPIASKPIVERIINLALNPPGAAGVNQYPNLVAILAVAVGEVGPTFEPKAESFNYDLAGAKKTFSAMKKLTNDEALKYIPKKRGGKGTEIKLANYVYGTGERLKYNLDDPWGGWNYKGRGISQMTFKSNYKAVQDKIINKFKITDSSGNKVDLLKNPYQANDIDVAIAVHVYGKLTGQFGLRLTSSPEYLTSGVAIQKLQNGTNGKSTKSVPSSVTKNYTNALAQIAITPWLQDLLKEKSTGFQDVTNVGNTEGFSKTDKAKARQLAIPSGDLDFYRTLQDGQSINPAFMSGNGNITF